MRSRGLCALHCTRAASRLPPPSAARRARTEISAGEPGAADRGATNKPRYSRCADSRAPARAKCGLRAPPALQHLFCRFRRRLLSPGRRPPNTALLKASHRHHQKSLLFIRWSNARDTYDHCLTRPEQSLCLQVIVIANTTTDRENRLDRAIRNKRVV